MGSEMCIRDSPSLDSSSKIEYESAKKCRVRVESMQSLDSDPSLLALTTSSTTQIPTYSISDAMEPNNLKDNHILDSHF